MAEDSRLAALIDPLIAARGLRRRRALADAHTLRLVALFVLTSGTILASGTHYLIAGVVLLVGVWAVTDRVRKGTRLPLAVNAQWLGRVIDMDLTRTGRDELTELLLKETLTPEELIPWGRAELTRQRREPTEAAHIVVPPPAPSIPVQRRG